MHCLLLVTNKHMAEEWQVLTFKINKGDEKLKPILGDTVQITLTNNPSQKWIEMMEIVMKHAKEEKVEEIYVTLYPTEELKSLIGLFEKYGFRHVGEKVHPGSVAEWVMAITVNG